MELQIKRNAGICHGKLRLSPSGYLNDVRFNATKTMYIQRSDIRRRIISSSTESLSLILRPWFQAKLI